MKLELESGLVYKDPEAKTIEKALNELEDEYAILSQDDMTYIQTSGSPERGFVVEYQIESTSNHFQSMDKSISLDDVITIFLLFAEGNSQWQDKIKWENLDLDSGWKSKLTSNGEDKGQRTG